MWHANLFCSRTCKVARRKFGPSTSSCVVCCRLPDRPFHNFGTLKHFVRHIQLHKIVKRPVGCPPFLFLVSFFLVYYYIQGLNSGCYVRTHDPYSQFCKFKLKSYSSQYEYLYRPYFYYSRSTHIIVEALILRYKCGSTVYVDILKPMFFIMPYLLCL